MASPLGQLLLSGDGENITGLWLEGQKYYAAALPAKTEPSDTLPLFSRAKVWLERYFDGQRPAVSELPLNPAGSEFRQGVWRILCEIPYGAVMSYGAIAAQMTKQTGRPASARAVGGAVGHNPISIVIPCHRVVGASGGLTGYAGGIDRKQWLLKLEGAA
jgi:methylated-DNA-[protein]-cysteine S-methyltransferase